MHPFLVILAPSPFAFAVQSLHPRQLPSWPNGNTALDPMLLLKPTIYVASSVLKGCKSVFCDLSPPCRAASKAAASSQMLFLVGDVLPNKNMFLDTLLVQGL